jgi:hypothetical protein
MIDMIDTVDTVDMANLTIAVDRTTPGRAWKNGIRVDTAMDGRS